MTQLARCASSSWSAQWTSSTTSRRGRARLARCDQPGHRASLTLVARRVVHGVVEGAQLLRLRQVEQVVEEDGIVGRHKAVGHRPSAAAAAAASLVISRPSRLRTSARTASRPVPVPKSSISPTWQAKPAAAAFAQELLHQPGLADARLAPDVDRLAPARLAAGRQRRVNWAQLALPADERRAVAGRRRPQAEQAPSLHRLGEALDRERARFVAVEPVGEGAPNLIRDQDLVGSRGDRSGARPD